MNKLTLDGSGAWFVSPDNKYGLSLSPAKYLTDFEFSMLSKIKVDWDKMDADNPKTRETGILIKNGLHLGITAMIHKNESGSNEYYLKATLWTSDLEPERNIVNLWEYYSESDLKPYDIIIVLDEKTKDEIHEIGFSFKRDKKEFGLYCDGTWHSKPYEGHLLDYSSAWLWIGASNPLESCPEDFRQFFFGEIYKLGVFTKSLDRDEMYEVYDNFKNVSKRLKPLCLFDFDDTTPYKVLDISGNGNNLIKFDKEWMNSI